MGGVICNFVTYAILELSQIVRYFNVFNINIHILNDIQYYKLVYLISKCIYINSFIVFKSTSKDIVFNILSIIPNNINSILISSRCHSSCL